MLEVRHYGLLSNITESVMNYINNVRAAEIREVVYVDDVIYYIGDGA